MKIEILDKAQGDLLQGFHFYESREPGLGSYFIDCLFSDIDFLFIYAGIHQVVFAYHRCLSKRFPFAICYNVEKDMVRVHAMLDCHQNVTIVSLNSWETLVA